MASGTYKNGVKIDLVYQAAACLVAAVPVGTVYDQNGAIHSAQTTALTSSMAVSANMLSGVAAGRYLGSFTPAAEGSWTVVIQDKNGAGEVSKTYEVCGHDLDSIGDQSAANNSAITSQLLLTQSTLGGYISNVESAVDLISSAAIVS